MYGVSHDAKHWDERYAAAQAESHHREHHLGAGAAPDPTVVEVVGPLPAGRALDLAAGQGRHALWLSARGWSVTAVDFSAVGLARGQDLEAAQPGATPIRWVVADATTWVPDPTGAAYDVVLCSFFHLDDDVFPRVREWLAPGGRLVVVGHALRNATDGVGGPSNTIYLHTEAQLRTAAAGLTIERLDEVTRVTTAGDQIDLVLVARRDPNS
jgi:SAM-dependent methyltransferase